MNYILAYRLLRIRRRIEKRRNIRILRELRARAEPFNLPDAAFKKMFRLTKQATRDLIEKIRPFSRPSRIPFEIQVFTAIHFFAQGSYQASIGRNHLLGLSQPSASRSIRNVTNLIVNHLAASSIKFPQSQMEKVEAQQGFYEKFGMSQILGAIDGTHIAIVAPPEMNDDVRGNLYNNRKGYHSLNVLACCDSKMRITYANAKFPGSVHDAAIWRVSEIRSHFRNQFSSVQNQESFLIGDSGFPLEPWLLTPYQSTVEGTYEHHYNLLHKKTRQVVERCFGVLKNRFRCLMLHRVLHYRPRMAARIVYAVMCLHNICIEHNIHDPQDSEAEVDVNESITETTPHWHNLGEQVRESYVNTICSGCNQ